MRALAWMLVCVIACPASAYAECVPYADYAFWTGSTAIPGTTNAAAAQGALVYLATTTGFHIFDVTDADQPVRLGSIDLTAGARFLSMAGGTAYVVSGSELLVIDAVDPASPVIVGRLALLDLPSGIAGGATRVCLLYYDTIRIVDASTPENPFLAGTISVGEVKTCTVYGNLAYVSASSDYPEESDLATLDITDAGAPREVNRLVYHELLGPLAVDPSDSALYMGGVHLRVNGCGGERTASIYRMNISTPTAPVQVYRRSIAGNCAVMDLGLADDVVGVRIYIVGSSLPDRVLIFPKASAIDPAITDVSAPGQKLVMATGPVGIGQADLRVLKHWESGMMSEVASNRTGSGAFVVAKGGLIYAAGTTVTSVTSQPEVGIYQVESDGGITPVGQIDQLGFALMTGLDAAEHEIFAQTSQRFYVIDATVPSAPAIQSYLDLNRYGLGLGNSVWFDEDRRLAVVTMAAAGISIIDVADPEAISLLSSLDLPGDASGITGVADYAYVAAGDAGLQIVNVTVPQAPTLAGGLDTPGVAQDVILVGTNAVIADGGGGLQVIDVSDSTPPQPVGHLALEGNARNVTALGNVLYVTMEDRGLVTVDLTNPAQPALLGATPATDIADMDVATDGTWVFLAKNGVYDNPCWGPSSSGGVSVLQPECPPTVNPVEITEFEATAGPGGIHVTWRIPFEHDVLSFRLERRTNDEPFSLLALIPAEGRSYAYRDEAVIPRTAYHYQLEVTYLGGQVDNYGPVMATAIAAPSVMRLDAPLPNPSSDRAVIAFSLPDHGEVQLRVLNVHGRVVKEIYHGVLDAGEHAVSWDGRDASGRPLPASRFYIELRGFGRSITTEAVRVK